MSDWPMPEGFDYQSIGVGYYDRVYHQERGMQSKWHHMKFDRLARELGAVDQHLDIACGPGTFIGSLPEGLHSIGVDIAESQIAYANERYGCESKQFQVVPAGKLPFEDAQFDAVTVIELVEHLTNDINLGLLREARRVLKPNGSLLLTTPNYASPWPVLEWLLNRIGDVSYEKQHITKFDRRRLESLICEAGFGTVKIESYLFLAPFTAAVGWNFADQFARLEPGFLVNRLGLSLLARARPRAEPGAMRAADRRRSSAPR